MGETRATKNEVELLNSKLMDILHYIETIDINSIPTFITSSIDIGRQQIIDHMHKLFPRTALILKENKNDKENAPTVTEDPDFVNVENTSTWKKSKSNEP